MEARGRWLFDRIVSTGSVVLSTVGGNEAGTAAAHRTLSSPRTDWRRILHVVFRSRCQRLVKGNVSGRLLWVEGFRSALETMAG